MESGHHTKPESLSRRSALAIILAGAGALAASALGLIAGFLSNALRRKTARPWTRIGRSEDLDPKTFQKYVVRAEHEHAWIRERTAHVIYIKDLYPADPLALLSTCSHLGCSVSWDAEGGRFRCPCHGGVYDEQGRVVAGPPPRPLTRLEIKIENDVCFVRMPGADRKGTSA